MLTAPVGSMEGRRRPLRLGHVLVTLEDLLIVTWSVPENILRKRMGCGLEPWTSGGFGRVSALIFRNRGLRPARIGFPRLSSFQMNLRSYVLDPGNGRPGCVFFHGLYLDRPLLARATSLFLRIPFRSLPLSITVERSERLCFRAGSTDGSVRLRAREEEPDGPVGLEMLDLLTNAHSGVVPAGNGSCRHWSIWHRNQTLRTMSVNEAWIEPLAKVFPNLEGPSGLYVDSIDYEVYLPAQKMGVMTLPRTSPLT